jgi:hypothetical protein
MIDFENLDIGNLDLKELIDEFRNAGQLLLSAEDVLSRARSGESLAGTRPS